MKAEMVNRAIPMLKVDSSIHRAPDHSIDSASSRKPHVQAAGL